MPFNYDNKVYETGQPVDKSLDDFIHSRGKTLETKLAVLMEEINSRIAIRQKNVRNIEEGQERIDELLREKSQWKHGVPTAADQELFTRWRQLSFEHEKEKREQYVSCWKDIVDVLNSILLSTWEATEQTKARAALLNSGDIKRFLDEPSNDGGSPESD